MCGKPSWGLMLKKGPEGRAKIQQVKDGKGGMTGEACLGSLCFLRLEHKVKMDVP